MTIFRKAVCVLGVWGWMVAAALAGEPTSNVHFSVIRDYNGKPVRNASVILHPVTKKGQQARSGLQLKTDAEGNTNFDGVPYGPLRIQVLVPGFQTYGEDFQINQPDTQITIKLKRPVDQYSIYGNNKPAAEKGTPPDANAQKPDATNDPKDEPKKDAKADAKLETAKPEAKSDAKAEGKPEAKNDAATKPDASADTSKDKPQN